MRIKSSNIVSIKSIDELHRKLALGKPKHPLISLHRYENLPQMLLQSPLKLTTDLYQITLKIDSDCRLNYGQREYDFNEGILSFFAPRQISIVDAEKLLPPSGWLISIHPDFMNSYPLAIKIKEYGFFHYSTNEALIMSEEEENSMETIFKNLEREYKLPIDNSTQDVLINHIELLLTYANRYYKRQFITRKHTTHKLLVKVEIILNTYFSNAVNKKLPTTEWIAEQLHISPKYLSDSLKQLTGKSLQHHIHEKLIERAHELLGSTDLSIAEIAYQLGFEYPQSFNKLFKNKTQQTSSQYRENLN